MVCDLEDSDSELVEIARVLRREDCIGVEGKVRLRDGGANDKLETGAIELVAERIRVFSKSKTPHFARRPRGGQNLRRQAFGVPLHRSSSPQHAEDLCEPVRKSHASFATTSATKVSLKWKPVPDQIQS